MKVNVTKLLVSLHGEQIKRQKNGALIDCDVRYAAIEALIRDRDLGKCDISAMDRFYLASKIAKNDEPDLPAQDWHLIKQLGYSQLGAGLGGVLADEIDEQTLPKAKVDDSVAKN